MRQSALRLVLGLAVMACAAWAGAVGVANDGAYRTRTSEIEPADPGENIRIEPPPTGGVLKVDIHTDKERYHVYDAMKVFFSVNRDSYIYLFDTDASGITHQIFPNYYDTNNFVRAGKTYYIPDRGYDLEVMGPQGRATLNIVAIMNDFPFLEEFRYYTKQDPYPASREGATALVRQIEQFRSEPSALGVHPLRPAPKENLWAAESTTYYVMGNQVVQPPVYKTPRFGRMDVDSYPSNARIFIDSDYYGRTSQVIDRLEIGYHHFRLEKEGYIPYDCNIYIKGNESKHMDIFLQETPVMPAQEPHDGQLRGGSTFGFFSEKTQEGAAACPPGTVPVAPAAVAPVPQPRPKSAAEDQETREK